MCAWINEVLIRGIDRSGPVVSSSLPQSVSNNACHIVLSVSKIRSTGIVYGAGRHSILSQSPTQRKRFAQVKYRDCHIEEHF